MVIHNKSIDGFYRDKIGEAIQLLEQSNVYGNQVVLGNVSKVQYCRKFGRNPDCDIDSTPEDIWSVGGLYTGFPTSGFETLNIVSTSVNNTSAGTGARTVYIQGLDSDFNEISETVSLNGTTPVTTSNFYSRINEAYVLTAGTTGSNEGEISAQYTIATTQFFEIPLGLNNLLFAGYTVPNGKKIMIKSIMFSISRDGAAGSCTFSLRVREGVDQLEPVFRTMLYDTVDTRGPLILKFDGGILIDSKSDLSFRAETISDNNTVCCTHFEFYVFDD